MRHQKAARDTFLRRLGRIGNQFLVHRFFASFQARSALFNPRHIALVEHAGGGFINGANDVSRGGWNPQISAELHGLET